MNRVVMTLPRKPEMTVEDETNDFECKERLDQRPMQREVEYDATEGETWWGCASSESWLAVHVCRERLLTSHLN